MRIVIIGIAALLASCQQMQRTATNEPNADEPTEYVRSDDEQEEVMLTQAYIGNKQSCEQDKDAEACALMKENTKALFELQTRLCNDGDTDACELAKEAKTALTSRNTF